MTLFDLWLIAVIMALFVVNVAFAAGCERLRRAKP